MMQIEINYIFLKLLINIYIVMNSKDFYFHTLFPKRKILIKYIHKIFQIIFFKLSLIIPSSKEFILLAIPRLIRLCPKI